MGALLLAQCAGVLSHAPGGLGVFDRIMALLLAPWLRIGRIVAPLVLCRLLYYVLPLTLALPAPFRQRLTGFVYRHGEHFDSFRSLLAYKEKFHPTWSPRYIAYPAGRAFPLILADVAALSAGGYARIVRPGA